MAWAHVVVGLGTGLAFAILFFGHRDAWLADSLWGPIVFGGFYAWLGWKAAGGDFEAIRWLPFAGMLPAIPLVLVGMFGLLYDGQGSATWLPLAGVGYLGLACWAFRVRRRAMSAGLGQANP